MEPDICPFCRSEHVEATPTRDGAVVRCMDCGARGPTANHLVGSPAPSARERAVAAWNQRTEPPIDLSAEQEALLVSKARNLVAAAKGVLDVISLPTLRKSVIEVELVLAGEGVAE